MAGVRPKSGSPGHVLLVGRQQLRLVLAEEPSGPEQPGVFRFAPQRGQNLLRPLGPLGHVEAVLFERSLFGDGHRKPCCQMRFTTRGAAGNAGWVVVYAAYLEVSLKRENGSTSMLARWRLPTLPPWTLRRRQMFALERRRAFGSRARPGSIRPPRAANADLRGGFSRVQAAPRPLGRFVEHRPASRYALCQSAATARQPRTASNRRRESKCVR